MNARSGAPKTNFTYRGDLPELFARRPELRDVFPNIATFVDGITWNT